MGKTTCEACKKRCKGQVIKLSETIYLHPKCFTCKECKKELPADAFFVHNGARYCTKDFQRLFGTKCHTCGKLMETDMVTVLGKTYHQDCILCFKCRKTLGAGRKVTVVASEFWCQECVSEDAAKRSVESPVRPQEIAMATNQPNSPDSDFAADMKDGAEDLPVSSDLRSPTSATSGYKSDVSGDQEVFEAERSVECGAEIPVTDTNNFSMDANNHMNESQTSDEMYVPNGSLTFGRFYQTSFLDKSTDFKRGPSMNPREKTPQHFHRPDDFSYRKVRSDIVKPGKTGNKRNTSSFRQAGESPYIPNKSQEPIQLAKIPDAQKFDHIRQMPIERDDFVAPPEPAAIYPELLREPSLRYKSLTNGDAVDGGEANKENGFDEEMLPVDPKIEKEICELSKMPSSGAAQMMLEELKKKKQEPHVLDPRSSSRTPSAAVEPPQKTRYESPVFASPSRDLRRARLWQFDDIFERKYRTCASPAVPGPGYGMKSKTLDNRTGCRSAMSFRSNTLDPGKGHKSSMAFRSATLDSRSGYLSDTADGYYPSDFMSYHRRPESSMAVLEHSYTPLSDTEEYDPTTGLKVTRNMFHRLNVLLDGRMTPNPRSSLRRNIPAIFLDEGDTKVYPYEVLRFDNPSRPPGLDNSTLEKYLASDEFERLFAMSQEDFLSLAEWKRNDLKQRAGLFESTPEKSPFPTFSLDKAPTPLASLENSPTPVSA